MPEPPLFDPHQVLPGAARTSSKSTLVLGQRLWGFITSRGWVVLGSAGLCLLLAFMLGRHELMALGCALFALVLGAWILVRFTPSRIEVTRQLPQEPVSVGQVVDVQLHCEQHTAIRELLPPGYPVAPTFHAPGVFDYQILFRHRGIHRLGPAQQMLSDPCNVVEELVSTRAVDQVSVRAQFQMLGSGRALGERLRTGEAQHTRSTEVDYYDVGIREHQSGDSLRQVHWKATARHGKLMVRQENYVATARSLIVLDRRLTAWNTPADHSVELPQAQAPALLSTQRFEKALSLACSIAQLHASHGYQLLVRDTHGEDLSSVRGAQSTSRSSLEEFEFFHAATASLQLTESPGAMQSQPEILSDSLAKNLLSFANEPVYLILGQLTPEQARWLASLAVTVRNVDLILLCEHPQQFRQLETFFAATSWRVHLPGRALSIREIWDSL